MVADMDWIYESPKEKYDSYREKIAKKYDLVLDRYEDFEIYQSPESAFMDYARSGQMSADLEDGYVPLELEEFKLAFEHIKACERDHEEEFDMLDLEDKFERLFI